jgi:hypothetical protein
LKFFSDVVRFANWFLNQYKTNKSCVVVAAFFCHDGDAGGTLHPVSGHAKGCWAAKGSSCVPYVNKVMCLTMFLLFIGLFQNKVVQAKPAS